MYEYICVSMYVSMYVCVCMYVSIYDLYTLLCIHELGHTGRFTMFSVITNIYNNKTKGPTLAEIFTATGKLIFSLTRNDQCVHHE